MKVFKIIKCLAFKELCPQTSPVSTVPLLHQGACAAPWTLVLFPYFQFWKLPSKAVW